MAKGPPRKDSARRRHDSAQRRPGRDLRAILRLIDRFEPWQLLWVGTMLTLDRQEPRAHARIMAKLDRHGLLQQVPHLEWIDDVPTASEPWRVAALRFTPTGRLRDDGDLARFRAYAHDAEPVHLGGRARRFRRPPPRALLVIAYYGARWYLKRHPPSGPRRRGDTLGDQAVAFVARHYGLTRDSADQMIKRIRPRLPPGLREWIQSEDGATLYAMGLEEGKVKT